MPLNYKYMILEGWIAQWLKVYNAKKYDKISWW